MDTPTPPTQGMQIGLPKELLRCHAAKSQTKETFNGWMATGWRRPAIIGGDASHCCLAFWLPWEMYGKTHWRLKQVVNGDDPQDSAWKHEYRCNEACWAMVALDCLCLMTLGSVPIAFERGRIRHTYGIDGSLVHDWALAFCCRSCTLLQNDREVRAREGNRELIVNPKYDGIKEQPKIKQQMTYQPQQGVANSPMAQNEPAVLPENSSSRDYAQMNGDGTSSLPGDLQDLSYIHDFSGAAVDRSILDYYERQCLDLKSKSRAATSHITFAEGAQSPAILNTSSKEGMMGITARDPTSLRAVTERLPISPSPGMSGIYVSRIRQLPGVATGRAVHLIGQDIIDTHMSKDEDGTD